MNRGRSRSYQYQKSPSELPACCFMRATDDADRRGGPLDVQEPRIQIRKRPSQRRFWAIQPTTSGGYSPSSFYNEPTFRATFPNQNIDITEGSNTIGKQGNLANSQFEYHGKAIGTISFTEQQPSFPTFTSYNNENQQPNQFKSSFNYQQPSFEQQPINSLFKTGYTSNELPITPSQTGIRWLPNYHGDQFTDPHRIMETQALNEQFFRSIGNQLDVRDY
ncbi:hypothetical protein M3Y96_00805800 [Aphelenchoides besseyi]|nr:hypothetical protein M3Y96_00805800 [Aphelenchoides besseyi]